MKNSLGPSPPVAPVAQSLAQCRHARGAGFVKAALSAGLAWQRRLREPSGTQIGWKQLALQEMDLFLGGENDGIIYIDNMAYRIVIQ